MKIAADESYVFIDGLRLPTEWVPDLANVLIVPPAAYPGWAPDGFYLSTRLQRRSGGRLVAPGTVSATGTADWMRGVLRPPARVRRPAEQHFLATVRTDGLPTGSREQVDRSVGMPHH